MGTNRVTGQQYYAISISDTLRPCALLTPGYSFAGPNAIPARPLCL